ncbi:MAG: CvpA family protein [Methylophilaceae bacterium]
MSIIDYCFIFVVVISLIFGCYRGFVKEFLSLGAWILAFYLAYSFSQIVVSFIPFEFDESINFIIGYLLIFIFVLIFTSFLIKVLSEFILTIGLGFSNVVIGALFGFFRGILAVYLVIFLVERTSFVVNPVWLNSSTVPIVKLLIQKTLFYLPYDWSNKVKYDKIMF